MPEGAALAEEIRQSADSEKRFAEGGLILGYKAEPAIEPDDQEAFEQEWRSLLSRMTEAAAAVALVQGFIELRLSLLPDDESQAGLVLPFVLLAEWTRLGGSIAVDSL